MLTIIFIPLIALLALVESSDKVFAQEDSSASIGPHCIATNPLDSLSDNEPIPIDEFIPSSELQALTEDADFCGCSWGRVYYNGVPISGVPVSIEFDGKRVSNASEKYFTDDAPFYSMTADDLGAKRGDLLMVTAKFAGLKTSRVFRALPESDRTQDVSLVLPEMVWDEWVSGDYSSALVATEMTAAEGVTPTIWAAGSDGLLEINMQTGISVTHTFPWENTQLNELVITENQHLWAAFQNSLVEFDGDEWISHTLPFSGTVLSFAIGRQTEDQAEQLWIGGGSDRKGFVARYDGVWQTVTSELDAPVTALTLDKNGTLWAGTWGRGVYQISDDGEPKQMTVANSDLASDFIYAIHSDEQEGIWVGTRPYLDGTGKARGGVGFYDHESQTWTTYGVDDGLPADEQLPAAPARAYALAADATKMIWVGTEQGTYLLGGDDHWYKMSESAQSVQNLIVNQKTLVVALSSGLERLIPQPNPDSPPSVKIETAPSTASIYRPLTFTALAQDHDETDEAESAIVAWEWVSDLDGPICTTAGTCRTRLSEGEHTIQVRVQDDEGLWSPSVSTTVQVEDRLLAFYLPLLTSVSTTR